MDWDTILLVALTISPIIISLFVICLAEKSNNSYHTYKKYRKKMEEEVRRAIEYNERYEREELK